jgi:uncharacterized membrane protein
VNPITRWQWLLRQAARQLWLTVLCYALGALASVVLGVVLAPLIPAGAMDFISPDATDRILAILASSMLAVTTFSLATMVTAHGAVTSSTSPRATALVLDNEVTRHALGVFIGSFLFSLVGLVALKAGVYGERGHVVLFLVTVLVIAIIVVALLRWIEHLSQLAQVSHTTSEVESATLDALLERARFPGLGARSCTGRDALQPRQWREILADDIGYVRHIDMAALIELCAEQAVEVYVHAVPGSFVDLRAPLLALAGEDAGAVGEAELRGVFAIGATRTFDYDPRFGLIVLGEIAARALSPGINDPGTAIDVLGRATRLLSRWATTPAQASEDGEQPPRIWLPALSVEDLLDDVFTPIARDGAANLAVQVRLQKALGALAALDHAPLRRAASEQSQWAWQRARTALVMERERAVLAPLVLPRPS